MKTPFKRSSRGHEIWLTLNASAPSPWAANSLRRALVAKSSRKSPCHGVNDDSSLYAKVSQRKHFSRFDLDKMTFLTDMASVLIQLKFSKWFLNAMEISFLIIKHSLWRGIVTTKILWWSWHRVPDFFQAIGKPRFWWGQRQNIPLAKSWRQLQITKITEITAQIPSVNSKLNCFTVCLRTNIEQCESPRVSVVRLDLAWVCA